MSSVAIVGVGQTTYRRTHPDLSSKELVWAASKEALDDAGLGIDDIDVVVAGVAPDALAGEGSVERSAMMGRGKPFLRVNTGGVTGSSTVFAGASYIKAGRAKAVLVFALGLVLDVMTQGPLGVWTAAALLAGLAGRLARRSQQRIGWLRGAALVIITLAAATGLVTVMTSLYGWQLVAVRTVLEAFVGACLAYPLLASLLSALDGLWPAAASRPLFLRGD